MLLRIIFNESGSLPQFKKITQAVSSDLLRVECLRTIDRVRLDKALSENEFVRRSSLFFRFQKNIELIPVTRDVLTRASQPFPISLRSLDAIHLASCILYRERMSVSPVVCTHDVALKGAAAALGFETLG